MGKPSAIVGEMLHASLRQTRRRQNPEAMPRYREQAPVGLGARPLSTRMGNCSLMAKVVGDNPGCHHKRESKVGMQRVYCSFLSSFRSAPPCRLRSPSIVFLIGLSKPSCRLRIGSLPCLTYSSNPLTGAFVRIGTFTTDQSPLFFTNHFHSFSFSRHCPFVVAPAIPDLEISTLATSLI